MRVCGLRHALTCRTACGVTDEGRCRKRVFGHPPMRRGLCMQVYYAHTDADGRLEHGQLLVDHLKAVAEKAAGFAAPVGASDWARVAGLLHDAGKASDAFQQRLAGAPIKVDHATAGAQLASRVYSANGIGRLLAFAIAGHHGGMPNWAKAGHRTPLKDRLEAKDIEPFEDAFRTIVDLPAESCLSVPSALPHCFTRRPEASTTNDARREVEFGVYFTEQVIFSSLVDADYLDSEHFMQPDLSDARNDMPLSLGELASMLDNHMSILAERAKGAATTTVNAVRAQVLSQCLAASDSEPGIFTLEVPTGGGKTLASLSFALHHALRNGQQRVIIAIPYTSIVEQTAATLKEIFGARNVLEHHSNYDFGQGLRDAGEAQDDERWLRERLLVQNWDAPIIVTTNVQLFESLFSNKPSRCRKVHNIANAVVILDEAQTLPDSLLEPTLAMIQVLADYAGTTTVLCTATQPNLDGCWPFSRRPVPIVDDQEGRLFEPLGRRTSYDCSHIGDAAWSLGELVDCLAAQTQILCVVGTQDGARNIYEALKERPGCEDGVFHLSARMIPEHRSCVIAHMKRRLRDGLPCRVVSTQLIEAGVDVDFPIVLREMAGIDSIVQAAGRCNRGGKLSCGHVIVFECPDIRSSGEAGDSAGASTKPSTRNWLAAMRRLGLETIRAQQDAGEDPFGRAGVRYFFDRRYSSQSGYGVNGLDAHGILRDIAGGEEILGVASTGKFSFEQYAEDYQFIADDSIPVFVPWGEEGMALLERIESGEVSSNLWRALQRFSVSVPRWALEQYESYFRPVGAYYVLETRPGSVSMYSEEVGLLKAGEGELDLLMV